MLYCTRIPIGVVVRRKEKLPAAGLGYLYKRGCIRNMLKLVTKIWNLITGLLVTAVLVLALLLAGVRVFGLQVFTVLSGSMEPVYHTGSVIYVKDVDYRELGEGDPITFMLNENTVATHRIVGVVPDEEDPSVIRYRTKGDANDAEDGALVHYKNVIGTPVFTIPYLGYVANYIQNPPGTYIAMSGGAFILLLVVLPEVFAKPEKKAAATDAPKPSEKPKKKGRYQGKYQK